MSKQAQVWVFDYIAAFLIFIFLLFMSVSLLRSIDSKSEYDVVSREADLISVVLMSSGTPEGWNETSMLMPGLTTDKRINLSKIEKFDSFNYERVKALLQVTADYWFYFKNSSGIMEINEKCVRGYPYEGCEVPIVTASHSDRAWSERIVVLDSQIVSLIVVAWR